MDCLFCRIVKKEIPSEVIYEDDDVLGFLDIHPLAPGHTVVIPKHHVNNILDLADNMIEPVFESVKKITKILNETLSPQGFTIGINHGKVSGQAIDHLHVHIVPRFSGDGGGSFHSVVHNPPKESIKEIKEKIFKSINDS